MKPTRNIVKPNTGLWNPKGSVWFKKNKDYMVYNNEGDEIVCRGHEEETSCKRIMKSKGRTGVHSTEWRGEDD
jgi:hypothetical protein